MNFFIVQSDNTGDTCDTQPVYSCSAVRSEYFYVKGFFSVLILKMSDINFKRHIYDMADQGEGSGSHMLCR